MKTNLGCIGPRSRSHDAFHVGTWAQAVNFRGSWTLRRCEAGATVQMGKVHVNSACSGQLLHEAVCGTVAELRRSMEGAYTNLEELHFFVGGCELLDLDDLSDIPEVTCVISPSGFASWMSQTHFIDGSLSLQFMPEAARMNRRVVLIAVLGNAYQLRYAASGLRDDPIIVVAALVSRRQPAGISALDFASKRLRQDPGMLGLAARIDNVRMGAKCRGLGDLLNPTIQELKHLPEFFVELTGLDGMIGHLRPRQ